MRWPGESSSAAVSSSVNPMSTSLTFGEDGASTPYSKRSPLVGAEPEPIRMGGEGRIPKRGRAVVGLGAVAGMSPGGVRQIPSPDRFMMSLIVRGGGYGMLVYA